MNTMAVDCFHAKIEYDEELDLFRGEIFDLNGGQTAGARSFAASCGVLSYMPNGRSFIVMKPTSDDEYRRIIGFVNQPMGVINSARPIT